MVVPLASGATLSQRQEVGSLLVVVDRIVVVVHALDVVEEFLIVGLFVVVFEVLLEVAASPAPSALRWAARLSATTPTS